MTAISPAIWTSYAQAQGANARAYASAQDFAADDAVTHAGALAGIPLRIASGNSDPFHPGIEALAKALPPGAIVSFSTGCHTDAYFTSQEPPSLAFLARHLTSTRDRRYKRRNWAHGRTLTTDANRNACPDSGPAATPTKRRAGAARLDARRCGGGIHRLNTLILFSQNGVLYPTILRIGCARGWLTFEVDGRRPFYVTFDYPYAYWKVGS